MMSLSQLHLGIASIAERPTDNDFQLVSVGFNRKYDDNNQPTDEIEKVVFTVLGYRGATPTVKLSKELYDRALKLQEQLDDDAIIRVSFSKLRIRPYAMERRDGNGIISGVSCSAEDFEVTKQEEIEEFADIEL